MRFLLFGLCLGLAGCVRVPAAAPEAASAPTPVTVSRPVERDVTDYADFTGRTAAVDSVEVRARVWGYLDQVHFQEGALVKKDDVLVRLDARDLQALLESAKAGLKSEQARYEGARAGLENALSERTRRNPETYALAGHCRLTPSGHESN